MKYFLLLFLIVGSVLPSMAQTKKINALKSEKAKMERGIQNKKNELDKTRKKAVKE